MLTNYKLLDGLPSLKEVIQKHNLLPDKNLGQHFLLDSSITDQIVLAVGSLKGKTILEIGPGPGGLTRSILASEAEKVVAIETDIRCIAALLEIRAIAGERLEVIQDDALKFDETTVSNQKFTIIANLPYNIGTLLLLKWLEKPEFFESIVVMLQKELVDKIVAQPKTKSYGRLSVLCQWLCEAESIFNVEPFHFYPPPKVDSAVIMLNPRIKPLYACNRKILERVTTQAFGMRRKVIRTSLKGILGPDAEEKLRALDINPMSRAEELSVEQFCKIANNI